jgi:hypothetical protein
VGLWLFGGSGGKSETYQHTHRARTARISLEYLRVRIDRPWLLQDVFGYRFWTWKRSHGYGLVSDGGSLSANPPVRPQARAALHSCWPACS